MKFVFIIYLHFVFSLSIFCFLYSSDLVSRVSLKEQELASSLPSAAEHAAQLQQFQQQKEALLNEISQYQGEMNMTRERAVQIAEAAKELRERIGQYEEECRLQDSRTAYAVSLYGKISNINWDYNQPPGVLAGGKNTT